MNLGGNATLTPWQQEGPFYPVVPFFDSGNDLTIGKDTVTVTTAPSAMPPGTPGPTFYVNISSTNPPHASPGTDPQASPSPRPTVEKERPTLAMSPTPAPRPTVEKLRPTMGVADTIAGFASSPETSPSLRPTTEDKRPPIVIVSTTNFDSDVVVGRISSSTLRNHMIWKGMAVSLNLLALVNQLL